MFVNRDFDSEISWGGLLPNENEEEELFEDPETLISENSQNIFLRSLNSNIPNMIMDALGEYYHSELPKEIEETLEVWELLANLGNSQANENLIKVWNQLASYFFEYDLEKSIKFWTLSANKGDSGASYELGKCYFEGEGVEQNFKKAVEFWGFASNKGHVEAKVKLAKCFYEGKGIEQNFKSAYAYWNSVANVSTEALFLCGKCFYEGKGVGKNIPRGAAIWAEASHQGNPLAQYELGKYYSEASPSKDTLRAAVGLFTLSANQGNINAQTLLGACYYRGKGVEKNTEKGIELLTKSANQGDVQAHDFLGQSYLELFIANKQSHNCEKAIAHFKFAADHGHIPSHGFLGKSYYLLFIANKQSHNSEKAVAHFKFAADHGHIPSYVNLGYLYFYGIGVTQCFEKAEEFWIKVASSEDSHAKIALLRIGFLENNGSINFKKFINKIKIKYPKGDSERQFVLGKCYYEGRGVSKDINKGIKFLNQAAKQNHKGAKSFLIEIKQPFVSPTAESINSINLDDKLIEESMNVDDNLMDLEESTDLIGHNEIDIDLPPESILSSSPEEAHSADLDPMDLSTLEIPPPDSISFLSSNNSRNKLAGKISFKPDTYKTPIIAKKYFCSDDPIPDKPIIGRNSGKIPIDNEKKVGLISLNSMSKSSLEIFYHKISTEMLIADYYSAESDLDSSLKNSKIVFVRVGRKENAFIPKEIEGGKIVLVGSPEEENRLKSYVNKGIDLLVVKNLPIYEEISEGNYQGLPTSRMMASLAFAWEYNLDNMMIIDDNIEGFYANETLIPGDCSFKDIYDLYQNSAEQGDLACLSVQTHRTTDKEKLASEIIVRNNHLGYKSFYLNIKKIKSQINDPHCLMPFDPKLFGEDMFLQYVLKEAGLKIGSFSKKTMVITRGKSKKNTCVSILHRPEKWLELDCNGGVPIAHKKAVESMKEMYKFNEKYYNSKKEKIENADLPKITFDLLKKREFNELGESSVSNENVTPPQKKRKTKLPSLNFKSISSIDVLGNEFLSEFANHIEINSADEILRAPQREALSNFSQVVEKSNFNTGYFKVATGVGKTYLYSSIVDAIQKCPSYEKHNLIITPGIQAANQVYGVLSKLEESQQKKTVACINSTYVGQKLMKLNKEVKEGKGQTYVMTEESAKILFGNDPELLNRFGLVIIDEFHDVSKELLQFTTLYAKAGGAYVLGFSGTTTKSTVKYFEKKVFDYNSTQGYKDGFLTPWVIDKIAFPIFKGTEDEKKTDEFFDNLSTILQNHVHPHGKLLSENQGIIRVEKNGNKKASQMVEEVAKKLNDSGIVAAAFHSKKSETERARILSDFNEKKIRVIVAHKMLSKAYDGFVDYTMILNKKIQKNYFTQCLGRVIRLDPSNPKKMGYMLVPEETDLEGDAYLPVFETEKKLNFFYHTGKSFYSINSFSATPSITSQFMTEPEKIISEKEVCRLPLKNGTSKENAATIANFISNPSNYNFVKQYLNKHFHMIFSDSHQKIREAFAGIRMNSDPNLDLLMQQILKEESNAHFYKYDNMQKQFSLSEEKEKEIQGIVYDRENGQYEILVPIAIAKFFAGIEG